MFKTRPDPLGVLRKRVEKMRGLLSEAALRLGYSECHHFDPQNICHNKACKSEFCRSVQKVFGEVK